MPQSQQFEEQSWKTFTYKTGKDMNLREIGYENWMWMKLVQDDGLAISGVQLSYSSSTLLFSQSVNCNHRFTARS